MMVLMTMMMIKFIYNRRCMKIQYVMLTTFKYVLLSVTVTFTCTNSKVKSDRWITLIDRLITLIAVSSRW